MVNPQTVRTAFINSFSQPPTHIFRAPGRVNLIGEHTDYNDGFVLPMAIDRDVLIAARRRDDQKVRMVALDFEGARSTFSLDAPITRDDANKWSDYVRGVAWVLEQRGATLLGLDLMIQGDIPLGSGLSSSAALEVCAATMFVAMANLEISKVEIAKLCQKAENEFVGVQCGIMDQFVSALAREGHTLLIDCRDLSYEHIPLPPGVTIVVGDTAKRRGLVDSEYNARRAECDQAARLLGANALRDITPAEFANRSHELPSIVAKRARHIIAENARVLEAVDAAEHDDRLKLGALMNASHESLRDDYQVSCAELDTMVQIARQQCGCLGARLTGAGFGGCTVNLVASDAVVEFVDRVSREYRARTGLSPSIYPCRASAGARRLDSEQKDL